MAELALPKSFKRLNFEGQKSVLKQLKDAARTALNKGCYIFPAPYLTKIPFKGTHGSNDARNDAQALAKWEAGVPANPCVRLDYSNLTVLDIDGGVGDYDNVMAWAKANGIPETYVVTTGRTGGGYHFYFSGTRPPERKDVCKNPHANRLGFELDGAHGDIKCHGHVVAEGGLHKTGATYRGNGLPVAPLPDWLRDWEEESVKARRETFHRQLERMKEAQSANVIPWNRRNDFLYRDACRLHYLGLSEETLYAALKDIAHRYCADGEEYARQQDAKLRSMATPGYRRQDGHPFVGLCHAVRRSFLVHGSQHFIEGNRSETGGVIGHAIGNDQFAVVEESATGINDVRHVPFTLPLVRFEQWFAEAADHFAGTIVIEEERANAVRSQGADTVAEDQPARFGLNGGPAVPKLDQLPRVVRYSDFNSRTN